MTIEDEPTSPTGPTAPKKNKGGRPRKVNPEEQFAAMAKQIANLQAALLEQGARQAERQQATLTPIPPPTESLPPGSYFKQGIDASGAPIMGKVRWTKPVIEATYPPVTFTPLRGMTVGPHGVIYRMDPGIETTVPSIVKDLYDGAIRAEDAERVRTRPMTAAERSDLDARAMEAPGRHMSRLARVGYGLNVQQPDTGSAGGGETPAT